MFQLFETYITTQASFTKEELALMRTLSTEKKLRRKQFLLQEGEVCRHKAFVVKGLLRNYHTKDDGTEYIMRFAPENSWTMDPESYTNQTPSKYSIEALEETEVIMWSQGSLEEMIAAIPSFKVYSDKIKERNHYASQNRVLMNISYTAEEKYQEFIASFPDIFRRVPLQMVASYLGMSRETLIRVRRMTV